MTEDVRKAIQPDGSLSGSTNYIAWEPGEECVTLDGLFSAADLRAIADHMDATKAKKETA